MAPEGCAGLLPIPRCSREHDAVAHLQTSRVQAMAECSGPPQSTRTDALGTFYPSPEPVDSSTPRSAPLSRRTLLRHSSFVRAVCVDALVRIWAGGDQRWSSLPRQEFYPRLTPDRAAASSSCQRSCGVGTLARGVQLASPAPALSSSPLPQLRPRWPAPVLRARSFCRSRGLTRPRKNLGSSRCASGSATTTDHGRRAALV